MVRSLLMCFSLFMLLLPTPFIYAQGERENQELEKQLEAMEGRLHEIYSQLEELKKLKETNPSPENNEKCERLAQEARDLGKQLQDVYAKLNPAQPEPEKGIKELPPQPPKPPLADFAKRREVRELSRQLNVKMHELKEIDKNLAECLPEEKDELQQERRRLQQEIENLKARMKNFAKELGNQPGKAGADSKEEHGRRELQELNRPELREILGRLQQEMPEEFQRLMELKQRNPREFIQFLKQKLGNRFRDRDRRPEGTQDPVVQELMQKEKEGDKKVKEITNTIRRTQGEERERLIAELRGLLQNLFDVRHSIRERQMQKEEERVLKMKEQLQRHKANKDSIIDRHLKSLVGEGDEWEW